MNDVMARLRAANPVPDPDAVDPTPLTIPAPAAVPRRRVRLAGRVLGAGALAAGAAVVLAVVGLPGDAPGPGAPRVDLAAAAARALDPGRSILHVIVRTTQRGPDVNDGTTTSEIWIAPGAGSSRIRTTDAAGAVLADTVAQPAGRRGDGLLDPVSAARAMLGSGRLRASGTTVVAGRRLRVFRGEGVTWYADPRTFVPVQSVLRPRPGRGNFTAITRFVAYERLADTPAHRARLQPTDPVAPRPVPMRTP